jgi:zinc protease
MAAQTPIYWEPSKGTSLVTVQVCMRTGAASDPLGQDGTHKLMLRALRRGCGKWSATEIDKKIDFLGAEFDEDTFTSHSVVSMQVIARNIEPAMDLLAVILSQPTFSEDEVGRLVRESVAELTEARDNDRALCQLAFRRALFAGHAFGRNASGKCSTLEKISAADLKKHHAAHVRRENLLFGFSGDLTQADAERLAARILEQIPAGNAPAIALEDPAQPKGRTLVFVDKPERSQHQILIGRHGTAPKDDDFFALLVAVTAFGGTFSAPLMKEIRSKRGWSYGASARLALERARHSFSMWTFPGTDVGADCISLELQLLETWCKTGPTDAQVAFVRNFMARGFAFDEDTAQKRLGLKMDVDILGLSADHYSAYRKHIAGVTSSQCLAALQKRLSTEDLITVVVGTKDAHLASIEKAIPRLQETRVIAFDSDF